ncbi:MAG TPA: hypothetical protein IAB01_05215 [Candidatus Avidesulfovibrio excrementigallinarum]|nr:hypothetical protein [Candidatus Avidesulfovibrio excrementigallinarum]
MAFTEQDMKRQMNQLAELKDEFSRLENQEKAMRKALGLSEQGGEKVDMNALSPEMRKQAEEAMAEAQRAGAARAAQSQPASGAAAGSRPGCGRRNVVRL